MADELLLFAGWFVLLEVRILSISRVSKVENPMTIKVGL